MVLDKWDKEYFDSVGIDPNELTENQIQTILIPFHAPENYHCDGEITPTQARFRWSLQLKGCGLSKENQIKALKLVK